MGGIRIMGVAEWMQANDVIAFRVYSSTDASDLPTGWTKPSKFFLDGVVFYDGENVVVFTDMVDVVLVKGKETKNHSMADLQSWLDVSKGATFVGYGSRKFDSILLNSKYGIDADHIDLAEIIQDASKKHYGDYGRRYDIHDLAELNHAKQTAIPHLSYLLGPIARLAEWRRGSARNVLRTVAAEVEIIARLFCQVVIHEDLKILDERTERPVNIPVPNARDVEIYTKPIVELQEEE
mgnify:CR=1 FL=1